MIEYKYCERWWITKKKQITPLTEKQAQKYHEKGKPYSIQVYVNNNLKYITDVCGDAYIISYLGNDLFAYCICEYHLIGKRLFLAAKYYNVWENNHIIKQQINSYNINGEQTYVDHEYGIDDIGNYIRNKSDEITVAKDVSSHWFDVPKFGRFEFLLDEKFCDKEF